MTRREVFSEFTERHVRADDGLAFHTDEVVERLWRFWSSRGRPMNVAIGIDAEKAQSNVGDAAVLFAEGLRFWISQPEGVDVSSLF